MMADEQIDAALSALAHQDITEHSDTYEQLFQALQTELNSTERTE